MKKWLFVFLFVFLAGCATERLNIKLSNEITPEKIAMIDEGATTKGRVIEIFGKPLDKLFPLSGDTFYYRDFNLRALWIEFDRNGVVSGYTSK